MKHISLLKMCADRIYDKETNTYDLNASFERQAKKVIIDRLDTLKEIGNNLNGYNIQEELIDNLEKLITYWKGVK